MMKSGFFLNLVKDSKVHFLLILKGSEFTLNS